MVLEAILLGLSTGTYCTMYCAPVLIPFLFGCEKSSHKRNAGLTWAFLCGRLAMYFALGIVFAALGLLANEYANPVLSRRLSLYAYIFCGLSLLLNSLGVKFPWGCKDGCHSPKLRHLGNDWVTALATGLSVGLHICPPLWTAMFRSVFAGGGLYGFFYFIFFYIGTLPFFIPLLGIPFVAKKMPFIKRISRVTQFCVSLYFLIFVGLIPFFFA